MEGGRRLRVGNYVEAVFILVFYTLAQGVLCLAVPPALQGVE